jgi:hypothetical protein
LNLTRGDPLDPGVFEDLLEAMDLANAVAVQVGSRAGQDACADFDTPVKAAGVPALALRYHTQLNRVVHYAIRIGLADIGSAKS